MQRFIHHKVEALKLFSLYSSAGLSTKFFLFLRVLLTPYQRMASELPREGKILDQGCGHGLFSVQLALSSKNRKVVGIDHDLARVELAKTAAKKLTNLEFHNGSFLTRNDTHNLSFEGVALIDVLHYFSSQEQLHILKNAYDALKPGGVVVFREVNPNAGLVSKINFFWEKLATFTKFTKSRNEVNLTFRLPADWEKLLSEAGFKNVHSKRCSSILFADVLFRGEKA